MSRNEDFYCSSELPSDLDDQSENSDKTPCSFCNNAHYSPGFSPLVLPEEEISRGSSKRRNSVLEVPEDDKFSNYSLSNIVDATGASGLVRFSPQKKNSPSRWAVKETRSKPDQSGKLVLDLERARTEADFAKRYYDSLRDTSPSYSFLRDADVHFFSGDNHEYPWFRMALPYIPGDELRSFFQRQLSLEKILEISRSMFVSSDILERLRVTHRDLHSNNIKITDKGDAMFLDFGKGLEFGATAKKLPRPDYWLPKWRICGSDSSQQYICSAADDRYAIIAQIFRLFFHKCNKVFKCEGMYFFQKGLGIAVSFEEKSQIYSISNFYTQRLLGWLGEDPKRKRRSDFKRINGNCTLFELRQFAVWVSDTRSLVLTNVIKELFGENGLAVLQFFANAYLSEHPSQVPSVAECRAQLQKLSAHAQGMNQQAQAVSSSSVSSANAVASPSYDPGFFSRSRPAAPPQGPSKKRKKDTPPPRVLPYRQCRGRVPHKFDSYELWGLKKRTRPSNSSLEVPSLEPTLQDRFEALAI